MKILAIETSCDDTSIAILEAKNYKLKTLSNVVSSQKIHQKYGGVFPMMAKREHQANLVSTLIQALKLAKLASSKLQDTNSKQIPNSKFQILNSILEREQDLLKHLIPFLQKYKKPDIDLIAVTNGPGLEPCLWVGVNFAKALSYYWDIPIVAVNHIESHILVNFIDQDLRFKTKALLEVLDRAPKLGALVSDLRIFPAVALVVSGGHTQLILVKGIGKYKIIGETRDDAAGECFDKCAKILGLGYPGGPAIAKIASQWESETRPARRSIGAGENPKSEINLKSEILNLKSLKLPRPMINSKDYDFSFSGLKTAVLYTIRDEFKKTRNRPVDRSTGLSDSFVRAMCVEVQQAIIDVLIKKTIAAAKNYKVKTIILGGGVSANQELRKQLKEKIKKEIPNTQYLIPNTQLSTDNALMIAITAWFHKNKVSWKTIEADANLRIGK